MQVFEELGRSPAIPDDGVESTEVDKHCPYSEELMSWGAKPDFVFACKPVETTTEKKDGNKTSTTTTATTTSTASTSSPAAAGAGAK